MGLLFPLQLNITPDMPQHPQLSFITAEMKDCAISLCCKRFHYVLNEQETTNVPDPYLA